MFGGFDPSGNPEATFFERRRWQSLLAAIGLVGGGLGGAFYLASLETEQVAREEIIEAEIQSLEIEEELEEELPEPPPPEPPPPSNKPVKTSSKPTPQPEIQNPDSVDQNPEERDVDSGGPTYGEGGGGNNDQGGGKGESKPEPKTEPKPELKPEPKPPKTDKFPYDPDKPIERPPEATVPKQIAGNPPVYPAELRSRNITGKVKVRLTIYKDGSVKAAKVLAKENSAEDPELAEKANKLLLKAVAAAVQTWKFKPSTVKGKAISVYLTVTIPFTLK